MTQSNKHPLPPRFKIGDPVLVDDREAIGHCRTPWYLRGLTGVVAEVHGAFRDPDRLAYHQPGLPEQILYKIRFQQTAIWPAYVGPSTDQLEADIYEKWLKPVVMSGAKSPRRTPTKAAASESTAAPSRKSTGRTARSSL